MNEFPFFGNKQELTPVFGYGVVLKSVANDAQCVALCQQKLHKKAN